MEIRYSANPNDVKRYTRSRGLHLESRHAAGGKNGLEAVLCQPDTLHLNRPLYQQNTMRDALVAAVSLNIFNDHCDTVVMANIAQLVTPPCAGPSAEWRSIPSG